jgi:hypothetical protein
VFSIVNPAMISIASKVEAARAMPISGAVLMLTAVG